MTDTPAGLAISEFKATCLKVIEQVKRTGIPVLVTRRGEPMAMVVPPPRAENSPDWLGSLVGTAEITGDIVSPVPEAAEWEALKE